MAAAGPEASRGRPRTIPAARRLRGRPRHRRGDYIQLERAALLAYMAVLICAPRCRFGCSGRRSARCCLRSRSRRRCCLWTCSATSPTRGWTRWAGSTPTTLRPRTCRATPRFPFVLDNRDVASAYGPLFSLLALPLAHLGLGTAVYALKALAGMSVLAAFAHRPHGGRARHRPPPAAALIALNPLVLVHVVGAHNDALTALVLSLGLVGARRRARRRAASAWSRPPGSRPRPRSRSRSPHSRACCAAGGCCWAWSSARRAWSPGAGRFGSAVAGALDVAGAGAGLARELPQLDRGGPRAGAGRGQRRRGRAHAALVAGLLMWTARGADWVRAAAWAGARPAGRQQLRPALYVILPLPLVASRATGRWLPAPC